MTALVAGQWVEVNPTLGYPAPGIVDSGVSINGSTVSRLPVGTIAQFRDVGSQGLGVGEFIWLPGVASTVFGDVVDFTISDGAASGGSTTRWGGTAGTGKPLAVATAATVASTWGWYQISGAAICNCAGAVAAGAAMYYGGTTAQLDDAQVNGKQVLGAFSASADDGATPKKAVITLDRPHVQGQVV